MDSVHFIRLKEMVYCKGLVVLTLKAINVTRPCRYRSVVRTFCSEVIPCQMHQVSGAVVELLGCGNHVDALIQDLTRFILEESVLTHSNQDMDPNCSLLRVLTFLLMMEG